LGEFDEKDIHIDLGSDQTSYIIRTQEDIIQLTFLLRMRDAMMAKTLFYSKKGTGNITPSAPPLKQRET
jgi:hypothetical protein